MEIKQFDGSPLDRLRTEQKQRSVSPMPSRGARPAAQLNSRQMFATALRRTDISPAAVHTDTCVRLEPEPLQQTGRGWSQTTTYENVEKLLQEADTIKTQMQLRSELSRREPRTTLSSTRTCVSSTRHSAEKQEFREISNLEPPTKIAAPTQLKEETCKDYYKDLYEKAVAAHAAERQKWQTERESLLRKIERLETKPQSIPAADSAHQVYLLKINREIEELKDRVRRTEQQNESIRTRGKKLSGN